MNASKFQFTKTATAAFPAEEIVRKGVLVDIVDALIAFIKEQAVINMSDKMDELFGGHWSRPLTVKIVSHSHSAFILAGVATVSVLATFEED